MSSSDYHPSSYSSLEQRRDRALRNRPDPYEKTTGRQSPAIVSPRDDHSTVTSSLRFEPTYLTSAVTKDEDSDGGGNSRSSSWEEAEADWACSVSSGTPKTLNHSKKQSNTRMLDPYVESIRESVDDFQSTDGEDSLLQSEDDDSAINQRLMKNKFNKHPKFRGTNFRKPATAHKGMHALQQPSIINSTQSRQKAVNNTVSAHGGDDDYSSNSNSVESFPTQAPPPILRKSESYISNQSNDTTLSDAESDADEDEEMNRNRRKVKFQETSRGVLQNTIHEYEDESITDTGTVLTDKSEQDDSVSTPNRAPPFPTIINENVEDALLDFFFLGKSAHPRPKKNKKSSRKKTSKESKKSSSSSRKNRNQEDFEKPYRKTREDDDFVPISRTTRNQEDFAPSCRKEDYVPSSRKTRDHDEYSADDDYTAGSQTTLDTNTVGSEGDDTTINSSLAYEARKKRQIAEQAAKKQADEKDIDPFEMVGNFCHIVGNVCGLSQGKPPKFVDVKNRKNGELDDGTLDSSALNGDDTSQNASKKTWGAFDFSSMDKAIDPQVFADAQSNLIVMAYKCQNWVEQTTGFKVAENPSCTTADDSNTEAQPVVVEEEQLEEAKEDHDETEVADENDEKELENGLLELVKCAARSKHLQNGSVFDETYDIDVTTEVKFLIVYASLPLGGKLYHVDTWSSRSFFLFYETFFTLLPSLIKICICFLSCVCSYI